jgi:hypothetical protein
MPKEADDKTKNQRQEWQTVLGLDVEHWERMFKANDAPINIAQEANDMISLWGAKAVEMAEHYVTLFALHGNEDKARDWAEVKKVIEGRLSKLPQTP